MRIAAIGDIHAEIGDSSRFAALFSEISQAADALLLAGDITEHGFEAEATALGENFVHLGVPVIAVLGNHDYYSNKVPEMTAILRAAGAVVLEGATHEEDGLGIAGLKGFGGGFNRMIKPIAEPETIAFTQIAARDANHLDTLLGAMPQKRRVVLMHYSPTATTLEGELREEYVFLGSSRYADVIDRHRPELVIHGHSEYGRFEGATPGGVPVRNVAMPVSKPGGLAYAVFDV